MTALTPRAEMARINWQMTLAESAHAKGDADAQRAALTVVRDVAASAVFDSDPDAHDIPAVVQLVRGLLAEMTAQRDALAVAADAALVRADLAERHVAEYAALYDELGDRLSEAEDALAEYVTAAAVKAIRKGTSRPGGFYPRYGRGECA